MDLKKTELKKKLASILPCLNEKQRRLVVASEAVSLGYGGIKILSDITGMSVPTIRKGIKELSSPKTLENPTIRRVGGGRKKSTVVHPELKRILEDIIEPDTRGDPESPLRWTCKSVRNISEILSRQGIEVSHQSVANILHELEYSLQGNKKTKEGEDHPDRNKQFKHINKSVKKFLAIGDPVISVDTKKKELIGNYKNNGNEWREKGNPLEVNGHDFPDPKLGKAVPYGIYDIGENTGWVNVGITADTAEFAVVSIEKWWLNTGKKIYKNADKLVICADGGGSNGYRCRLWKKELQRFATKENLAISVHHFPPGTSKWNKIEHKLFSFISINWRGKPLLTYRTVVRLIAATTTEKGLSVKARLDTTTYKTGIKVSEKEMLKLNIRKDKFHGEWNYTIHPKDKLFKQE